MEFNSVIKARPLGGWYIELTDMRTEQSTICENIDEYMNKIEEMGADYPEIKVNWSQESGVLPAYINEIRAEIKRYEEQSGDIESKQ